MYNEVIKEDIEKPKSYIYRARLFNICNIERDYVVILPSYWSWSRLGKLYTKENLTNYEKNISKKF